MLNISTYIEHKYTSGMGKGIHIEELCCLRFHGNKFGNLGWSEWFSKSTEPTDALEARKPYIRDRCAGAGCPSQGVTVRSGIKGKPNPTTPSSFVFQTSGKHRKRRNLSESWEPGSPTS